MTREARESRPIILRFKFVFIREFTCQKFC